MAGAGAGSMLGWRQTDERDGRRPTCTTTAVAELVGRTLVVPPAWRSTSQSVRLPARSLSSAQVELRPQAALPLPSRPGPRPCPSKRHDPEG